MRVGRLNGSRDDGIGRRLLVTPATPRMPMPRLLSAKEAAERLQITKDQLAALVQDGELAYINVGRGKKRPRRRYTDQDIDELVDRRRRREVCLSGNPKAHRSTATTSGSAVIGFMARLNAPPAKKPRP